MLNRFIKIIHNKYSTFFKFIFSLRYLFVIFIISITLFLTIPIFFDYEKKADVIRDHLFKNYHFNISSYDKIKYSLSPVPILEFENVKIKFDSSNLKANVKTLKIYPKILNTYNYENYQSNKIVLKDAFINIEASELKVLKKYFSNKKNNNLLVNNFNLKIYNENKTIITMRNIKFANYGHNRNVIKGKMFDKSFKTEIDKDFEKIKLRFFNSGIKVTIDLDESKAGLIAGTFRSRVLNTNLKFNFNYENYKLNIYNSYFRSKDISFKNSNEIVLKPFIDFKSIFQIEKFNTKILKKINIDKLLLSKDIIKKINSKNTIIFKSNKFSRNLIDELNLTINLAYGRVNYLKKLTMSENFFQCSGYINLIGEHPLLYFNCNINLNDRQNFFKKFSIKNKDNYKTLQIYLEGNLSVLNRKIIFKKISVDEDYTASKEDLEYFKETFENILLRKGFFEIFNVKRIKEFILEIS